MWGNARDDQRQLDDLHRLDGFDRWLVITFWRALLWKQRCRRLPFIGRLAVVNSVVVFFALLAAPSAAQIPRAFVPLLWMGSYCLALAIVSLLPRRHACEGANHGT